MKLNQLKVIAPYVPCGDHVTLAPEIYEIILNDFLKTDTEGFLKYIRHWPPNIYNQKAVVNAVIEDLLVQPNNTTLVRALATLYTHQRKYDKALEFYLKLGHKDVFNLVRQHRLFKEIQGKIVSLLNLDQTAAIQLFLEFQEELPPDMIVSKLDNHQRQMFLYLDALYTQDKTSLPRKYHTRLVRLYATFSPNKLLKFLDFMPHSVQISFSSFLRPRMNTTCRMLWINVI